ncbi:MAG: cyclase family protein [Dethiobacteria bacterium]|nr:cyclase family protein [Bacillota bacterium]HOP69780.1 cyclase family protein [Bacillota bacterium]HPT33436.1 cyclase family protein [Bacillota bacterium]HQD06297.1 cyclase family protein [Bacillota bacterium]
MPRRIIDLSVSIENDLPSDPPMMIPKIQYIDHALGRESMRLFFPEITEKDLPQGLGWAMEMLELSTHSGTHLDAPWHYHPTMDGGDRRALTIDEVPLEWCFGSGVKLDFSHKPDGCLVTAADMKEALDKINYKLKPLDVVLVYTGASKAWGTPEYLVKGCGMGREATLWLLEQGVRVTGTDAWSWDRPLALIADEFKQTRDPSIIWEGHFAGIEKGYCHMEKLANLDQLPPTGFTVCCFPVKIKAASAGWVRAVAILD